MISAVILAAGESRRMGAQNKLLLPVGEEAMIRKFVKSVCASNVDKVLVVLGHDSNNIKKVLLDQPVRFVNNPSYKEGMTTSIKSGVDATSLESDGFMICLSDLPFVENIDFNLLVSTFSNFRSEKKEALVIVPVFDGKHGNPVVFSSEFREKILKYSGEGCHGLIEKYPNTVREVIMGNNNLFHDIDTPEDYKYIQSNINS